ADAVAALRIADAKVVCGVGHLGPLGMATDAELAVSERIGKEVAVADPMMHSMARQADQRVTGADLRAHGHDGLALSVGLQRRILRMFDLHVRPPKPGTKPRVTGQ